MSVVPPTSRFTYIRVILPTLKLICLHDLRRFSYTQDEVILCKTKTLQARQVDLLSTLKLICLHDLCRFTYTLVEVILHEMKSKTLLVGQVNRCSLDHFTTLKMAALRPYILYPEIHGVDLWQNYHTPQRGL